jgi:NAD(P)-dependent dehydrogenase (short-subunit alcohol dehydrogenase family)
MTHPAALTAVGHSPAPLAMPPGEWSARLTELIGGPLNTAAAIRSALILSGRLRRCRPELLPDGDERNLAAFQLSKADPALLEECLGMFRADGWTARGEALAEAYDVTPAPWTLAAFAEDVLAELDDADVVIAAAGQTATQNLSECLDWLGRHADLFLAASPAVRVATRCFRTDLAGLDAGLARTTVKYWQILGAAAGARAEMEFRMLSPFNPKLVRAARRPSRPNEE